MSVFGIAFIGKTPQQLPTRMLDLLIGLLNYRRSRKSLLCNWCLQADQGLHLIGTDCVAVPTCIRIVKRIVVLARLLFHNVVAPPPLIVIVIIQMQFKKLCIAFLALAGVAEASESAMSERLTSLTKTRARGPKNRKLPTKNTRIPTTSVTEAPENVSPMQIDAPKKRKFKKPHKVAGPNVLKDKKNLKRDKEIDAEEEEQEKKRIKYEEEPVESEKAETKKEVKKPVGGVSLFPKVDLGSVRLKPTGPKPSIPPVKSNDNQENPFKAQLRATKPSQKVERPAPAQVSSSPFQVKLRPTGIKRA